MSQTDAVDSAARLLLGNMEPAGPLARTSEIQLPPILAELAEMLEAEQPVLRQSARWSPSGWTQKIGESVKLGHEIRVALTEAIQTVERHCGTTITRQQVFDLKASVDPFVLFVAVMAWGYGPSGYAPARLERIAGEVGMDDLRGRLAAQIGAAKDPAEAWAAWHQSARIKHFGTAFASKLAYFAGTHPTTGGGGPLIADANVAWAMWAFTGLNNVREVGRVYLAYVEALQRWGSGIRPDALERALFRLGPAIRREWRNRWRTVSSG